MKLDKLRQHWNAALILLIGVLMVGAAIGSLVTGNITYKSGRPQFARPYTIYKTSEPSRFYWGVGKLATAGFAIIGLGFMLYRKER